MDGSRQIVANIFNERRKFVIIGLTGRTGSGCSTTSKLFETEEFHKLNIDKPLESGFRSSEERRYRIVYDFSQKNWQKFRTIKCSNVLTSYILEENYESFKEYYSNAIIRWLKDRETVLSTGCISQQVSAALCNLDQLKDCYDKLHVEVSKFSNAFNSLNEDQCKIEEFICCNHEKLDELFFTNIEEFSNKLKVNIEAMCSSWPTKLYQEVGNNIRVTGKPLLIDDESNFSTEGIFKLPSRINFIIKCIRKSGKKTFVVIDCFRNPYEISFFRERYSSFYLFAIKCDDEQRKKRLFTHKNFNDEDVSSLDLIENYKANSNDKRYKEYTSIKIKECISLADVHLENNDEIGGLRCELSKQLIRYVSLILHPGLITPSRKERMMQLAFNAKLSSGCISRQVGAVVTDSNYSVTAIGWNTVPEGQIPCNLRYTCDLLSGCDKTSFSEYERTDKDFNNHIVEKYMPIVTQKQADHSDEGKYIPYCFSKEYGQMRSNKNEKDVKDKGNIRALHAEENAFLQAAKYGGTGLKGGFLYSTASTCELCAKKAYQLGISEIIYLDQYPDKGFSNVINSGTNPPKTTNFVGVVGQSFVKLYQPIMPYKDEIEEFFF